MINFLKKIKYLSILAITQPAIALAYDFESDSGLNTTGDRAGYFDSLKSLEPESIITLSINYLLGAIGVIFLILTISSGVKWMTAGGNDEQLAKAKKTLTQSIIGIIIVFSAYVVSYFVINYLTNRLIL